MLAEFKRAGRETLTGTVVTGLAQGVFAGIGYWMLSGVPQPAFFGAATAVASLLGLCCCGPVFYSRASD